MHFAITQGKQRKQSFRAFCHIRRKKCPSFSSSFVLFMNFYYCVFRQLYGTISHECILVCNLLRLQGVVKPI
ncbi:hypothetical protein GLYMA_02G083600v4 [Glycine max]|uniref:Uncharacterized protein n=1 Tax=Glycine max TaxID=3847 RepID=K7K740_SOYBN|nr:hypothetical protein JHK85_003692 [Glycine max]KRH70325.1 hypothetical protein GLYMA_02G083600v4 [Glycine max]